MPPRLERQNPERKAASRLLLPASSSILCRPLLALAFAAAAAAAVAAAALPVVFLRLVFFLFLILLLFLAVAVSVAVAVSGPRHARDQRPQHQLRQQVEVRALLGAAQQPRAAAALPEGVDARERRKAAGVDRPGVAGGDALQARAADAEPRVVDRVLGCVVAAAAAVGLAVGVRTRFRRRCCTCLFEKVRDGLRRLFGVVGIDVEAVDPAILFFGV